MLEELSKDNPGAASTLEHLEDIWNAAPVRLSANNPKNQDAYLMHISRLKEVVPDFEASIAADPVEYTDFQLKAPRPLYKRISVYVALAACIVLVVLAYPYLFTAKKVTDPNIAREAAVNQITVNPGSRTKVQLPDGSQVWVNSDSKLTYQGNFKGNLREVELDGEAYFDVVRDPAHPFIVHTSGIDIKVLGTAFDVKAYTAEPTIEATLIHGSIEVINKAQPGAPKIMLKPHEKLVYNKYQLNIDKDGRDEKDLRADVKAESDAFSFTIKPLNKNLPDSNIIETAWVYNRLSFEEERFSDLALRMERWYNIKITIDNEKLKNYRISGSFENETVEEALKELQFLVSFQFTIKNGEVIITKK